MNYIQEVEGGVVLSVRVMPNAKRQRVEGIWDNRAVKVAISAPPVDEKANKALVEFLADLLKMSKKDVLLISGLMSRDKKVKINGDKTVIIKEIDSWIQKSLMEKK